MGAGIPGLSGLQQPLEVGPGPGWRTCQQRFHEGHRFILMTRGQRSLSAAGPPGWWQPDEAEAAFADGLGVDLLLVPGLTAAWECSAATRCDDRLLGRRGDALLAVPRGWEAGGGGAAARRRMLYVHGARFSRLSPFSTGFPLVAAELAALTGGPVLVHDYPLGPVGSWRDALAATLAAARWLLACEWQRSGGGGLGWHRRWGCCLRPAAGAGPADARL